MKKKNPAAKQLPKQYVSIAEKAFSRAKTELPDGNFQLALIGDSTLESVESVPLDFDLLNASSAQFIIERLRNKFRNMDADLYMLIQPHFTGPDEDGAVLVIIETKEGRWGATCSEKEFRSSNDNFKKLTFKEVFVMKPAREFYTINYEVPSPQTDHVFKKEVLKKISESSSLRVSSLILNYELAKDINTISIDECRDLYKRIYEEIASITGVDFPTYFEEYGNVDAVTAFKTLLLEVQTRKAFYESIFSMEFSIAHTILAIAINDFFLTMDSPLKKRNVPDQAQNISIVEVLAVVSDWLETESQTIH